MIDFQHVLKGGSQIVRFIFSGVTVAVTSLLVLYVLHDVFHVWYLAGSIIAFVVGLGLNFFLQKNWTFRDTTNDRVSQKAGLFALNAGINLLLNTTFMYMLVDIFTLRPVLAQACVMVVLATMNYVIYRVFIFPPSLK